MSRPPSNPPPCNPPEQIKPSDESALPIPAEWGLSTAQGKKLLAAMRGMIWQAGCPVHLHGDVVQDAFVVALSKPISERVSVTEWNRFVSWMCTLAKYSTFTHRNKEERRRECNEVSEEEIAERLAVPAPDKDFLALEALEKAVLQLEPEAQALLRAHYFEGKSIQELANEKELAWTTIKSRIERVLDLLRFTMQLFIIAKILLVTKNARAHGARLARCMSHVFPHATQAVGAMAVTVVCGVLVPASSMAAVERPQIPVATLAAAPKPTFTPAMVPAEPTIVTKVEPEKPIAIDELVKQWSAPDMNSFKIVRYLQATMLPFAFVFVPAVTQVACSGSGHQTRPVQEPDDGDYGGSDPYDAMCDNERRRGNDCESKADWCASMGMRAAPHGCQ